MKWILGALVLLAAAVVFHLGLLVYAMYVLLAVVFICRFFSNVWIGQLETRRFCGDDVVEIGSVVECKVALQNTGRLSIAWLLIEESLPRHAFIQTPPRLRAEGPRLALAKLGPGETKVLAYKLTVLGRGYFQLGPVLAETGDVFGLHRRFKILTEPHYILVPPKVLPLEGYNLASRRPLGEIRVSHRLFEDPTRVSNIRDYQAGDPLNRIHWRATARAGQLQSRTYESSRIAGATFLLDFHKLGYTGPTAAASAELAVVAVASLANAVLLTGQQMGFVTNGRDAADRISEEGWRAEFETRQDAQKRAGGRKENTRLRPVIVGTAKGEEQFSRILMTLARLEQTDGLDFGAAVAESVSRISRDSTVVAVMGTVGAEAAAALGGLARRGYLVTAVIVSMALEAVPDWARPPEWASLLLDQGIDFRLVNSEEALSNLCAEAIVR